MVVPPGAISAGQTNTENPFNRNFKGPTYPIV